MWFRSFPKFHTKRCMAMVERPGSPRPAPLQPDASELLLILTESIRRLFESCLADDKHDLCISSAFCASLLRPDPCDHLHCLDRLNLPPDESEECKKLKGCCRGDLESSMVEGVPVYPLYKQVACNLCHAILFGSFPRKSYPMPQFVEDEDLSSKVDQWIRSVTEKGNLLRKVLRSLKYHLHVQEKYYTQLRDGSKTVEGRCPVGDYSIIQPGDNLLFNNSLLLTVKKIHNYAKFEEMLHAEGLDKVLPGVQSIAEGEQVYRTFYPLEVEKMGVLALHVSRPDSHLQPCTIIADMFSELQAEGLLYLLGIRFTIGTLRASLPPPKCALLSAFCALNSSEVAGSSLTVGSRALAKHSHRSSSSWWGVYTGKEAMKNAIALDKVCDIIEHACWMNVQFLSPSLHIFEIRIKEGYGARWSVDGSQFRGFLEPPMEGGHLKGWRH